METFIFNIVHHDNCTRCQLVYADSNDKVELAALKRLALETDIEVYFCDPSSPWQRGSNENINDFLRQYFPKKTDFRKVSWKQVKDAVESLNNRPRKTRGYLTLNQLFNNTFVPLV